MSTSFFARLFSLAMSAWLSFIAPLSAIDNELPPFALLTVPKSGSHLMIKALHLLTGGVSIWHTRFPSFFYIPPRDGFLYTHLCLSPELEDDYQHLPQLRKIINIRDLRDVAVSIVAQIKKYPWPGMNAEQHKQFLELPFDEQLLFVINYDYDVHEVAATAPNSLQVSLRQVAEQTVRLSRDPRNLVCRYENLVGSMGGGSEEAQLTELERIASFLELEIPSTQLAEIAAQLYGNEFDPFGKGGFQNFHSTFKQGKIGLWRELFTEEHKRAFKKKIGNCLIALNYESDDNW